MSATKTQPFCPTRGPLKHPNPMCRSPPGGLRLLVHPASGVHKYQAPVYSADATQKKQ